MHYRSDKVRHGRRQVCQLEFLLQQFLNVGFVQLNQVIDRDTVNQLVDQIRDELAERLI